MLVWRQWSYPDQTGLVVIRLKLYFFSFPFYGISDGRLFWRFLYITQHVYSRFWPVLHQHWWWYSCLSSPWGLVLTCTWPMFLPLCLPSGSAAFHHTFCALSRVLNWGLCVHALRHSSGHMCVGSVFHARGQLLHISSWASMDSCHVLFIIIMVIYTVASYYCV